MGARAVWCARCGCGVGVGGLPAVDGERTELAALGGGHGLLEGGTGRVARAAVLVPDVVAVRVVLALGTQRTEWRGEEHSTAIYRHAPRKLRTITTPGDFWAKVDAMLIGTDTAPVTESGSWPTWMARVPKRALE